MSPGGFVMIRACACSYRSMGPRMRMNHALKDSPFCCVRFRIHRNRLSSGCVRARPSDQQYHEGSWSPSLRFIGLRLLWRVQPTVIAIALPPPAPLPILVDKLAPHALEAVEVGAICRRGTQAG